MRVVAKEQGKTLGKITFDVSGVLDLNGFLGLAKVKTFYPSVFLPNIPVDLETKVSPYFQTVTVNADVETTESQQTHSRS